MAYVKFQPLVALRAARRLAANVDDLPQVFTIIEALSAGTLERLARRIRRSPASRDLLSTRPDIVPRLADRAALGRLPAGSLGRAYLAFVEREMISAEGIVQASMTGKAIDDLPAPLDWVNARMRDTHDLWHAATGYSGDVLGETALLAFLLAQTWNPGVAVIIAIGMTKTLGVQSGAEVRRTIADGFRRGRRAAWLPGVPWETLLDRPVTEVRARLSLGLPPVYTEVRSSELRLTAAA
jgi:ubiquinone biosynthesis protein COQ4